MKVVILCAGFGRRLEPITNHTEKYLVKVPSSLRENDYVENLTNTIEVLSEALTSDIEKIIVVRRSNDKSSKGYWYELKRKFPVKDINILLKYSDNNIVSLCAAFDHEDYDDGLLVVEGDIYIDLCNGMLNNLQKIKTGQVLHDCNVEFTTYRDNEWVITKDYLGHSMIIKNSSGNTLSGITYIHDVSDFVDYLSYQNVDHSEFWNTYLYKYCNRFEVVDCTGFIKEYDTVEDLLNIYDDYDKSKVAEMVVGGTSVSQITDSMTNNNYVVVDNLKDTKVVRLPGKGTDKFISRDRESFINSLIYNSDNSLTPRVKSYNSGLKITEFIPNCRTRDLRDFEVTTNLLSKIHKIKVHPDVRKLLVDLIKELDHYESLYDKGIVKIPDEYFAISDYYRRYILSHQHENLVLCHRDLDPRNILIDESGNGKTIDFEYAGLLNIYWDYAALLSEDMLHFNSKMTDEELCNKVNTRCIENLEFNEYTLRQWRGIVDYVWSCWTIAEISLGKKDYIDYFNERWKRACEAIDYDKVSTISLLQ